MICWICNKNIANSCEHIIKKSDMKLFYGHGSYKGDTSPVHTKNSISNKIQGANSKHIKYKASICSECNGRFSQPFDIAYEKFIKYVFDNEQNILKKRYIDFFDIYGLEFEVYQRNLYKYFAKSFGCKIVNENLSVPEDVRDLLSKDFFQTALRINISVNEDIMLLPIEHRHGFIGKGPLSGYVDKNNTGKINRYEWSEHILWLTISYWYNTLPDGNLGSIWIADNQFIYLGSAYSLDKEQRKIMRDFFENEL